MPRPCLICTNGLAKVVKTYIDKGKSPKHIIKKIQARTGIFLSYAQYRYHVINHDPTKVVNENPIQVAKKKLQIVRKKEQKLNSALEETTELLDKSKSLADNVQGFFEQIMGTQQLINSEEFAYLPLKDRIAIINQTATSMARFEKLKMEHTKLGIERDFRYRKVFNVIAEAGKPKAEKQYIMPEFHDDEL